MTAISFQPTQRSAIWTGQLQTTMPYDTNHTIGYAWIKAGPNTYAMRARFDGNGRLTATAPAGTPWHGEGWTDAQRRVA